MFYIGLICSISSERQKESEMKKTNNIMYKHIIYPMTKEAYELMLKNIKNSKGEIKPCDHDENENDYFVEVINNKNAKEFVDYICFEEYAFHDVLTSVIKS